MCTIETAFFSRPLCSLRGHTSCVNHSRKVLVFHMDVLLKSGSRKTCQGRKSSFEDVIYPR
jgi:hypothetical protein